MFVYRDASGTYAEMRLWLNDWREASVSVSTVKTGLDVGWYATISNWSIARTVLVKQAI